MKRLAKDAFRTKTGKPVSMRVTLTVEADTLGNLEKAIDEAAKFGKAMYIGISYHWKKKPQVRVGCRTTRSRRKVQP